MKMAKPYRILTFLCALFVSAVFLFIAAAVNVNAEEDFASGYFTYTGRTYEEGDVEFDSSCAKIKLYGEDYPVNIKNELAVNDFAISFYIQTEGTYTVKLAVDSYDKNGNKSDISGETEYNSSVENVFTVKYGSGALTAAFNGLTEQTVAASFDTAKPITLIASAGVSDYFINGSALYDGTTVSFGANTDNYYKVNSALAALPAEVSITGEENSMISLLSVNQKYSEGNEFSSNSFVQDFVVDDETFENTATPIIALTEGLYNYKTSQRAYVVIGGYKYSADTVSYSFLGTGNAAYTLKGEDDTVKISGGYIAFNQTGTKEVYVKNALDVTVLTYSFKIIDYTEDVAAPEYNMDADAIASFKAHYLELLEDSSIDVLALNKEYFYAMVSDDYCGFENMSATLYYWSDDDDGSSTTFRIPVSNAGHYRFIVLFKDYSENEMEEGQFFYADSTDPNKELYGVYKDYIFEFDIEDSGELEIKTGTAGTGYKDVQYVCSAFTVSGDDYTAEYKLYYSATEIDASADGWQEIIAASAANDEDATYGAFTYKEIKAIDYDGDLIFTPDRTGYYKFVCTASSTNSARSETAFVTVEVKEQVKTVTPDTHWLENNVWSVVFLSVGSLSLIGIIVLLFIKPKEDEDGPSDK